MIKWDGFGKLLKQLFFISLISCFIFLGNSYVKADNYEFFPIGINKSQSYWNNQYDVGILPKGRFLSLYLGTSKNVISLDSQYLIFWTPQGGLYLFNNSYNGRYGLIQGYFQYIKSCDSLTNTSGGVENCTDNSLISPYNNDVVSNFMSTLKSNDLVYIEDFNNQNGCGGYCTYYRYRINVCFSSSEIGKTLCFVGDLSTSGLSEYRSHTPFTGNQGLTNTINFSSIPNAYLSEPPGFTYGGSSDGSSVGIVDSTITGDYVYADCTWNDIFITLESEGYNKYVCYGGLDNFDDYDSSVNYNPIAGRGLTIMQIWSWTGSSVWDSFPEWFTFWNGLYKDTNNDYTAMWESYPAVYRTYFKLYNAYKGSTLDPRTLLEYCQARLTFTGQSLNNSAGGYFRNACQTVITEKQTGVWQTRVDGTIYSGGVYTGDVPISVNWGTVSGLSGMVESKDAMNFIQDFFNKAKSTITTDYNHGGSGFLPSYIILFLCAIVLFRFISH